MIRPPPSSTLFPTTPLFRSPSTGHPPAGVPDATAARAADHLWMHFARQGRHPEVPVPVVTRGEGAYIWDNQGRKILDGLSGLFVVQVGHGRRELAEAADRKSVV